MKLLITCLLPLVIFCSGCFYSDQKISFHDRVILGADGVSTYLDYLKIENYREGSFTASQLCEIANEYVDTIHADKIVSDVIFLRYKNFRKLPEHLFDVSSERMGKLSILGFSFAENEDNSKPKNISHNMKLRDVVLFKNGEHKLLYTIDSKDKLLIDSLLASKEPYQNK